MGIIRKRVPRRHLLKPRIERSTIDGFKRVEKGASRSVLAYVVLGLGVLAFGTKAALFFTQSHLQPSS